MNLSREFDRIVRRRPHEIALAYVDAAGEERSLTFQALSEKVRRAAGAFRARGIGKGDRVAVVHRNDPAFVVACLGLIRVGAIAVPLNYMVQQSDELAYLLGHCRAKGVVTQAEFAKGIAAARERLPGLKHVWISDEAAGSGSFWGFVEDGEPVEEPADASGDDVVMVLYTAAMAGDPRGAMLTHANLLTNGESTARVFRFSSDDVVLAILPMFHSFGWTVCVLQPILTGAKVVIGASIAPPTPWLARMKAHGVTVFSCIPQVYALLAHPEAGYRDEVLLEGYFGSVRLCVSGAGPLSPRVYADFQEAFGLEITEGYGLTETSPVVTINPLGKTRPGSVGVPIPGVSVRIVDGAGRTLPAGEEGEILIKGPNVMKGYLDDEAATRETISEDGWLRSGDLGVIDEDGYVSFRGLKKDMIIVKGLKVYPAQLERTLRTHPDIREAAVVGIPDETMDEMVKAFIVLREGAVEDKPAIRKFCREKFDPYKRPKDIEFLKELPKDDRGAPLKRVLRDRELSRRQAASA